MYPHNIDTFSRLFSHAVIIKYHVKIVDIRLKDARKAFCGVTFVTAHINVVRIFLQYSA